jgi:hypothetical protein
MIKNVLCLDHVSRSMTRLPCPIRRTVRSASIVKSAITEVLVWGAGKVDSRYHVCRLGYYYW